MKVKNHLLFAVLVWVMLFILAPFLQAQFICTTNNGHLTITSYTGANPVVAFPNTLYGLPVTTIGDGNSIVLPNNGVTSVTMGTNVTSIGALAFYGCNTLTSVSISASVSSIGVEALSCCHSLTNIVVDPSNPTYSSIGGVLIFQGAFLVQFPDGLGGSYTVPQGVSSIGNYAFDDCCGITSLLISSNVYIGAMQYCARLTTVVIGGNVTGVGGGAFDNCANLTSVYFQGNAVGQNSTVFQSDPKATIYYPPGASGWGPTFDGLPAVVWNPSTQSQFNFVTNNGTITITGYTGPAGSVTIPVTINGLLVTSIGSGAFQNDLGISNITIPNTVTSIGANAFAGCVNLTGINFLGNEPGADSTAFQSDNQATAFYLTNTTGWTSPFAGIPATLWSSTATVSLGSLSQVYDGTAKNVSVSTAPSGLAVTVTYNGSLNAPTNAGTYTVVGAVNAPNYQTSSTNGTLVINKAAGVVALGNLAQIYDGAAKSVSVTTAPPGLGVNVTYNGSANPPVNIGSYTVVGTITDPNSLTSSTTNTLIVVTALPAEPILKILQAGTNIVLTWPTNYPGYILQSTTNLVLPTVWSSNPPPPVVVNGQNHVTNPIVGSQKFYRLNLPISGGPLYTIGVSTSPVGTGVAGGGGTFYGGTYQTVTATPNPSCVFVNWTENSGVVSSSASYGFILTTNRTLVANFIQDYTISVSASPGVGGTVGGGGTFAAGTSQTVTATANTGYTFVNWTENGAVVSSSASYGFTLTTNRTLVANFTQNTVNHTITVSASPTAGGTVGGGGTYAGGSTRTVTATAKTGYTFVDWTEGGVEVSTSSSYTFILTTNRTLVANFSLNNYTITVSAAPSAGGTVGGGGTFAYNTTQTVTAAPNPGYSFVNWTENGTVVSSSASYGFTLTTNRTLVANFTLNNYTITVSASPSIGGTVGGGGTFAYGTTQTVTATAKTGYVFLNWTEGGTVVSTASSYSFTLTGNRTLVANFSTSGGTGYDGTYAGPFTVTSPLGTATGTGTFTVVNGYFDSPSQPGVFTGNVDSSGNFTGNWYYCANCLPIPMTGKFSKTAPFVLSGTIGTTVSGSFTLQKQ